MLNDGILKRLDALSLRLHNLVRGSAGGARRTRTLGSSAEFSDFREYSIGDDIRRIDWNAYARFERLFLKLFMEEQEAVIHLIVDASASMKAKWAFTGEAVQVIAYLALSGGDRVRIIAVSGMDVQESALFAGRKDFMKLVKFLDSIEPAGETKINEAIPRLRIRQRGMTVMFSDLFSDSGYDRAFTSLSYQKQELLMIHVLALEEVHPNMDGAVRLIDSETDARVDLLASGESMRRYRATLDRFMSSLKAECHKRNIVLISMVSHEDALEDLLRALMRDGMVQ